MNVRRCDMRKKSKGINYRNRMPLSEEHVATIRDEWDKYVLNNGEMLTTRELMELGQLGSYQTASKLHKAFKLNAAYPRSKKGYKHQGVLSFSQDAEQINVHLCYIYL